NTSPPTVNNRAANELPPAGQALVSACVFTAAQLIALGATPGAIALAPKNQADLDSFKAVDMRFSVPIKLHERITLEPSVQLFNIFNFVNFDTSGNLLSGVLAPAAIAATGTPGSVNGTPNTITDRTNRVAPGTGVFQVGAPRQIEFG